MNNTKCKKYNFDDSHNANVEIFCNDKELEFFHCPICLEKFNTFVTFSQQETIEKIPKIGKLDQCGHSFCAKCIGEWAQNHSTCCPICNTRFHKIHDKETGNIIMENMKEKNFKGPDHIGIGDIVEQLIYNTNEYNDDDDSNDTSDEEYDESVENENIIDNNHSESNETMEIQEDTHVLQILQQAILNSLKNK